MLENSPKPGLSLETPEQATERVQGAAPATPSVMDNLRTAQASGDPVAVEAATKAADEKYMLPDDKPSDASNNPISDVASINAELRALNSQVDEKGNMERSVWSKIQELESQREVLDIAGKVETAKPMTQDQLSNMRKRMDIDKYGTVDHGISGEDYLVQAKLTLGDSSLSDEDKMSRISSLRQVVGSNNAGYLDAYEGKVLNLSEKQKSLLKS